MGASVLSMLLLLNASVTDWPNEINQDTRNGKKGRDACGASLASGGRIIGGRNAIEGEFPWVVAVLDKESGGHICGGSIIKPDIVLTAAHCVTRDATTYTVLAAALDYKNPPNNSQLRNVQKKAVHESFSSLAADHDIALLKLEVPFDFSESKGYIGAVCLPAKDRPSEGNVEVIGWGVVAHGGPPPKQLLAVSVPIKYCNDKTIMFCTGSKGEGPCAGDSGGPAVQKEGGSSIIVGVYATHYRCGDPISGFFTRVSAYIDWISENTVKLQA